MVYSFDSCILCNCHSCGSFNILECHIYMYDTNIQARSQDLFGGGRFWTKVDLFRAPKAHAHHASKAHAHCAAGACAPCTEGARALCAEGVCTSCAEEACAQWVEGVDLCIPREIRVNDPPPWEILK